MERLNLELFLVMSFENSSLFYGYSNEGIVSEL